ncbi:MAG: stage 0 sporulation family protein [Clostridia bacterium]|nr:stage 0 sporulation family protein [Clostridia bacterium]
MENQNDINTTVSDNDIENSAPSQYEVVGVKFKSAGKTYYFSPEGMKLHLDDKVIVRTSRGIEFGFVACENKIVSSSEIVPPLREVERIATNDDIQRYESNKQLEKQAFDTCLQMIAKHNLEMKLIEAEYTFDNSKLLFYFSAEGRVDFRELVKDLAAVFHTRIELRQIGIRDEAKMMGGIGVCGRPFCCATFLSDFVQVSIKMAKEQNLSLNSAKISGTCGRLMCCLRYESDVYEEELKRTPPVDSKVKTPDGIGFVREIAPLTGICTVVIPDKNGEIIKKFHRDQLTVLQKKAKNDKPVANDPSNED